MENGAVLGIVDMLARKHRGATAFNIGSNRQFLEKRDRFVVDPAFRPVKQKVIQR